MSKFKVGDKVRALGTSGSHRGAYVKGKVYTVTELTSPMYIATVDESGESNGWSVSKFELVERPLEDWEQELLNGSPTFKPGDRVAVAFEDVITSISGGNAYFNDGLATLAVPLSSLTKLTDPIPTAEGAVIRLQNSVYELEDNGYWESIGSVANYSHKEIQGWADTYGFTVLYAGDGKN